MAKSMVEKYQQILADDPGSMVFVELAKALLDSGDHHKAADICRAGLEQHPDSIVGRVLLGRALISTGKPVDAMEQFDQAIGVEKDNPYAYNLIGEVLLHKGLYRSALPILKKAVLLQPGDQRVRQWLEQAQRALNGGAAPSADRDATEVDARTPDPRSLYDPTVPTAAPVPPPEPAAQESPDHPQMNTQETIAGISGVFQSLATRGGAADQSLAPRSASAAEPDEKTSPDLAAIGPEFQGTDVTDPYGAPPSSSGRGAPPAPDLAAPPRESPREEPRTAAPPPMRRTSSGPNVQISPDLYAPPPIPRPPPRKGGLFDELPDDMPSDEPKASDELPSVVVAPEAAAAIAQEYERELREKLLAAPPKSFWRRHWLGLTLGSAAVLAAGIGAAIYVGTRRQNQGHDLITLRGQAFRALAIDTPLGYRSAVESGERVLEFAPTDADARSAIAYASAALFGDHGGEPGRRTTAERHLEAARSAHPGLALAGSYYIASDATSREAARKPVLAARTEDLAKGFEGAEVLSLAGRLLVEARPEDALPRFQAALEADPGHVRSLVALGSYYLAQSDPEQALRFFDLARAASPDHVPAHLGVVDGKLALGGEGNDPSADFEKARAAFKAADDAGAPWPPAVATSLDLAEGRILALQGRHGDAAARLTSGASAHPERAADFFAALGAVEGLAGSYDRAETAYLKAVERRASDDRLKEELARATIARGRPAEALKRLEGAKGDRGLRTVRGLARMEAGDAAGARADLMSTQHEGKMPIEAALYLALLNSSEGQADQREAARGVLVKTAAKGKSAARVGLARLFLSEGKETQAVAELTKAEADRRDWEGACTLGRLHLNAGRLEEAARHLGIAVDRNKLHVEARLALGQALLGLGRADKAQVEYAAAIAERPTAAAHRGQARVFLALGDLARAQDQAQRAARLDPKDPDGVRLAAQVDLAMGDAQNALRSLEKATRAAPKDAGAQCDLGETLLKVGNVGLARKAFDAALKLDRENLRARLGIVQASLPKQARAVQRESEELIKSTQTEGPALWARALALNARVHLSLGDAAKGWGRAQEAAKADDTSADAHLALALAAQAKKDGPTALVELQRAVALDPVVAEAHLALAVTLAQDASKTERAIAELEAYLRIAPKGPDAAMAKKVATALKRRLEE